MSGLDLTVAVVLVVSIVFGAFRGFVREVMSLLTWSLATLVAWVFAEDLVSVFEKDFNQPTMQLLASFVLIFVIFYFVGTVISVVIHRIFTRHKALKFSNQILGAGVGAAKGVLIVVAATVLAGLLPAAYQSHWWKQSKTVPFFESAALSVKDWLPKDIAQHIRYN